MTLSRAALGYETQENIINSESQERKVRHHLPALNLFQWSRNEEIGKMF